jgi:hypothetical protein
MTLHTFFKYLFDLALTVFWIYIPMFHLGLKDSKYSAAIWAVDILTLATIIYFLHRKGPHRP